jgi:hypothetical protein
MRFLRRHALFLMLGFVPIAVANAVFAQLLAVYVILALGF